MLLNRTSLPVEVRYNGKDILINPGELLNVIDFGIGAKEINPVEKHILKGYPNTFDIVASPSNGLTNKEADKKILDLTAALETSHKMHENLKTANDKASKKNAEQSAEINEYEKEIQKLKTHIAELKAKLKAKDMPDIKK